MSSIQKRIAIVIKVTQTKFGDGKGNCVAACLASIFELDIDDVDIQPAPSANDLLEWTKRNYPDLSCIIQDFGENYQEVEDGLWRYDFPEEKFDPPPEHDSYWLLGAKSPRIVIESGPYRGMPGLHCVVMKDDQIVWDPHPDSDKAEVGDWLERIWWVPKDQEKEIDKLLQKERET